MLCRTEWLCAATLPIGGSTELITTTATVGFLLGNSSGVDFAGTNTLREGHQLAEMWPGDTVTVDFHLTLPELYPGAFSFSPAVADGNLTHYKMCDWIDNAVTLQMGHGEGQVYGYLHLPCRVEVNGRLG